LLSIGKAKKRLMALYSIGQASSKPSKIFYKGKAKQMIKGFFIGLAFVAFNLMIAFLIINIATGCGMVNDWNAPQCVTPAQLIGLG
jgi:DNA integrity scanning protein DisA with diadenylate cyclase activity